MRDACDKCKNANPISYRFESESAWKTVVLNKWRQLCPGFFDVEAEKAGVRYSFVDLEGAVLVGKAGAERSTEDGEEALGCCHSARCGLRPWPNVHGSQRFLRWHPNALPRRST